MTIRLRGHHLLCVLTYVGKGYTPGFTENYDRVAGRLAGGEEIVLVDGPDDICAPLLDRDDAHCRGTSVLQRDVDALVSVGALLERVLAPGSRITPDASYLAAMRMAFAGGEVRTACKGCEWSGLCDTVSASGFAGTRLSKVTGRPSVGDVDLCPL